MKCQFYLVQLPLHLVLRVEIQIQGRIWMILCPGPNTNTKNNFSKLFHCLGFFFFFFLLTGKQLLLGNRPSCYSQVSFLTVNIFVGTHELFQLHRSIRKCGWNPRNYLLIHLQLDLLLEILRILLLIIQPKLKFPLWSVLQCHPALGNQTRAESELGHAELCHSSFRDIQRENQV